MHMHYGVNKTGKSRFALWELTKREIERKYARSYLGVLWSSVYPLLRMALVVVLFSTIFDKGIEKYPAYYFSSYLIFEFYKTATETSLTTLKDNKDLLIKSKLQRELFVLSRVLTAFINFLLGCIPYLGVLIWYHVTPSWRWWIVPVDMFFLVLFIIGISYALSIWFVFLPDCRSIYSNLLYAVRYFVPTFYSIDWVSEPLQKVISHNPPYSFIKIARDCIVYNQISEPLYFIQMIVFGIGFYLLGRIVFVKYENCVVERL